MFGYVRPPLEILPQEEAERFRRAYCGLCHTLGERYGPAARMILNYDFTYLAILLSDPEEAAPCRRRCVSSPVRLRAYQPATAALELAADESVILAYWQLRDGVEDHGLWKGLGYRVSAAALRGGYRKAAAARPEFDGRVREQLAALSRLEGECCPSMDQAADTFAQLLAAAAAGVEDPVRRRVLEQMLYHLGRWVYLIDAADDLQKDAVSGNYNPVALRYGLRDGKWDEESRRAFARTLDHSIHMIATAFELWDFGVWRPLLESTVYTGLFAVGRAVLEGTFHKMPPREQRKKHKKAEDPCRRIDWYTYTSDGTKAAVVSTYHSVEDGWYLRLPDVWKDQILITRTAGTEEVTVTFSYRGDSGEPPQDVLRITKLTGSGREARATRGGRVILRRLPEIIYTAELLDANGSWEYGLTEDEVREAFSLITTEWSAGDS